MSVFRGILCGLVVILMVAARVAGQSPYIFHHLSTEDGLSNSNVTGILRDSYGFLWIGTESGLNRYDGYGYKVYTARPGVPNSMVSSNVQDLKEDGLGNIWIGSVVNMVYNRDKDNFSTDIPAVLMGLGISVGDQYKVHVDKKKDLWVLTQQKAYHYDTRKRNLSVFDIEPHSDAGLPVDLSDNGQSLYGILASGSLWQLDKHTGKQAVHELKGINMEAINKIYVDSRSGVWLYSWIRDVLFYQKDLYSGWETLSITASKTESDRVLNVMDDENGRILIGTDHNGLFIYDRANDTFTNLLEDPRTSSSLASNNIRCLYKDDSGIIWIGHNKKGISYYHSSFNTIINVLHPECRDVSVIMEDRQGNIWLGTDGNGLFVKGNAKDSSIRKLPLGNIPIVSLVEDQKGRVWIGTYLHGLFCYENGEFSHFTRENSRLATNDVWNLEEDRYGNLWIGTLGGGIQYLKTGETGLDALVSVCEGMKHPLDMCYDGGDKLYIGTVYGLYVVDITTGNHVTYFGNERGTQQFQEMAIYSAYKDKVGNIWLGHPTGLTLWDVKKDTLYYIDKENGLSDNIIRGITEDNHQNVWVTTSNGLSILSVENDSQGNMLIDYRNFSTKDGFKDNYFNSHAIHKLRSGDILLGGTEGYTLVNPNKLAEKNQPPAKVIFTGLSVGADNVQVDSIYRGKRLLKHPIEQTDSLTFSHDDKLISLTFTSGDLLYADRVKYAYMLEGFNDQWLVIPENKVVFSSLPPGNYKLLIKACNSDGVWNEEASVLNIAVTPPFYLSRWALIFYGLLAIGFLIFIRYWVKRRHRIKLELHRAQLEGDQKANLNEMKLRFFTNISHDLRTPLTLITTPLQTILSEDMEEGLRRKLQTMNKNAEQLLQLINSLLDFRKLDAGAESLHLQAGDFVSFVKEMCVPFQAHAIERPVAFSVLSEMESLPMKFDPDKVRKVVLNLLSNAFKFTPNKGRIEVHLYREKEYVYVNVSDSGQGINGQDKKHIFEQFYQVSHTPEQTGSGIGLHIVSEYIRIHGGTISVSDNAPKGSIFTFKLPIVEAEAWENEYHQDEVSLEDSAVDDILEQVEDHSLATHPVLLLVDDNKDFCEFMADSLSDEYTVLLAHDGQEALEQLEDHDVNVVVSDIMMPIMNGIELCNRIKTNVHWSHIPVILLTARTAEEYKIEGLEMGADDYLTKPFNFNLLKLRIRKFLEWTEKCHTSFGQKMDISPSEITITPLDEQLLEKAIKIVEEHISNSEFSVEDLGSAVCLSRSHLYKKLMNITGRGPAEFIRTIRLKRSRQLLEKSQLQIAEIAYAVGFNSPKRYAINFKNEFGMSPSQYLREIKDPQQH